jgi:hypothetical protein
LKANWNEWASEKQESKQQELTAVPGMTPHPDQGFYYRQGHVISVNLAESSRSIKTVVMSAGIDKGVKMRAGGYPV